MEHASQEEIPLDEAEHATMGFTHCETGRALAEKWNLADDIIQVIAHHHAIEQSQKAQPLVALVHLSDLLCRMRGLGYGYYERHKVDLSPTLRGPFFSRNTAIWRAWTWCDSPLNSTRQSKRSTPWSPPCLARPHREADPAVATNLYIPA